jgi:hypothetical protein
MNWKLVLEYLKVLLSWPVAVAFILFLFRKELRSLLDRIKKLDAFGISAELGEQLVSEAKPTPQADAQAASEIDLSVSTGGYSNDYHAIFLVVGITNRTDKPDQVISWRLSFPSLNIELEPTAAPHNLVGGVPWWPSPLVELPPNKFIQGSLFFRGKGPLAESLPDEPLHGRIVAETLHRKKLSQEVEVYRLATLQAKAKSP